MGLLDIFKKNKETKADETAQIPEKENAGTCNPEGGRRFTLLIEDVFQLKDDGGVVVVGNVHGTIGKGDSVYLIHPGNKISLATVQGLETKIGDIMNHLETATDIPVSVMITDIRQKSEIEKFSLLTSIRPQPGVDVNTGVENPYVLGLSCEYGRFQKDNEYLNILIYEIAHAHYLVPVILGSEPEADGTGKAVFTKDTTMTLPSLSHPEDEEKLVFPVFTDWKELNRWEGIFSEEHPAKTMIFLFPDCSMFATNQNSGMVINPFSQNPIFLPDTMIDNIRNSPGYQNEFVKEVKPEVEEVKIEKGTRITLGVPKDVSEVRLIRQALIDYGKRNGDLDAIYLLLKINEDQQRVYFCVTDSEKELDREVYAQMYQEARPFAEEVTLFEFAGRNDIAQLEQCLTEEALIYKKQDGE